MDNTFSRVDSMVPLPQLMQRTADAFQLGDVQTITPILTGYQDCNIDLLTSSGRYVIKIFSKDETKHRIENLIWAYITFAKAHVPIPVIRQTTDHQYLLEISGNVHPSYLCVFEYFSGKPLTRVPITDVDITTLTHAMTIIHKSTHAIHPYYDTMAIVHLPEEFKKKISALSQEEITTMTPIISKFNRIKLSTFPQSIIHGTFEKENVLKNTEGEIRLLDFGCMDYHASVLDIATFIANFTLYVDQPKRKHITQLILDTYASYRPLSSEELSALPTLIRSQYAAYIVGMSYHMRIEHDMTKQTQTWLDHGWDGLHAYTGVTKLI